MQGHAPVRSDVYEDPGVLRKYPYYREAQAIVRSGEAFPVFAYSARFEDLLGSELALAASGEIKPAEALKAAADALSDLMKKQQ
jgi:multiple sugar transport system substrate-binding protein